MIYVNRETLSRLICKYVRFRYYVPASSLSPRHITVIIPFYHRKQRTRSIFGSPLRSNVTGTDNFVSRYISQ